MTENKKIFNKQKTMIVEISPDNNFAWLTILNSANMIDENELIEFLNMAGIRFGFENASIQNKTEKIIKQRDIPFLIAKGSAFPPKPSFELFFDPNEKTPVTKNTILAKIINSEKETKIGKNIFGEELTIQDFQFDPALFCGKNCTINDEMQIIAAINGSPEMDENKIISIQAETILENIIDKELTFQSDLIVNGEINSSKLMINGNLYVYGDIVNCEKGIYVNGDIKFLNASRSNIYCSGKISFENSCSFCNIIAENEILGAEESSIVGGYTQSAEKIKLSTAGNDYEEPTALEISIAPYLKEQIKLLDEEIKCSIYLNNIPKTNELQEQKKILENKFIQKITEAFTAEKDHEIEISHKVFKNIKLRIYNQSVNLDEESDNYTFTMEK